MDVPVPAEGNGLLPSWNPSQHLNFLQRQPHDEKAAPGTLRRVTRQRVLIEYFEQRSAGAGPREPPLLPPPLKVAVQ